MPRKANKAAFGRPTLEARTFVLEVPQRFGCYRQELAAVFFAVGAFKVEGRSEDGAFEITFLRDTRPTANLERLIQRAASGLPKYLMRAARAATARTRMGLSERIGRPAPGETAFEAMQREFRESSEALAAALREAGVYEPCPEDCEAGVLYDEECVFCGQPIGRSCPGCAGGEREGAPKG